jgi:hypothetical protein
VVTAVLARTARLTAVAAAAAAALVVLAGAARADADRDLDRIPDALDNCPAIFNPDQQDDDGDGLGNACDSTPGIDGGSYVVLYLRDQHGRPVTSVCFDATVVTSQGPEPPAEVCGDLVQPGWATVFLPAPDAVRVELTQTEAPPGCSGGLQGSTSYTAPPGAWKVVGVTYTCQPRAGDRDLDGVPDSADNCPDTFNPDQLDEDDDGVGNTCDRTPGIPADTSSTVFYLVDQDGAALWDACFDITQVAASGQPDEGTSCVDIGDPGWTAVTLVAPDDLRGEVVQTAEPPGCAGGLRGRGVYPFAAGKWNVVTLRYRCGLPVEFADSLSSSARSKSHGLRVVSATRGISVVVRWKGRGNVFDVAGLTLPPRALAARGAAPRKLKITRTRTATSLTLHIEPAKLKPGELAGRLQFTVVAKSIAGVATVRSRVVQAGA